jgi:hypothetical protein
VEDRGRQVVFEFKPENPEKVGKRHSRIHSKGRSKLARRFKVGAAAILSIRQKKQLERSFANGYIL